MNPETRTDLEADPASSPPGPPLGPDAAAIFGPLAAAGTAGSFALYRSEDWLLGSATVAPTGEIEAHTGRLYAELLTAAQGWHLARIWNFVPAINATGTDGLENYRAFCRARSLAFERRHGARFRERLPSASAVGASDAMLTVSFAASTTTPRHVENPLQVPAYDYPEDYGPRPPSFARASVLSLSSGATIFISGTSAVRGHETVAPFDTERQCTCLLENLREISAACGLGPDLGAADARKRVITVYHRRPEDRTRLISVLGDQLLRADDSVVYLQADICRAPLNLEIEVTLKLDAPTA